MADVVRSAQKSVSDSVDAVSSKLSSTMQGIKGLSDFAFGKKVLDKMNDSPVRNSGKSTVSAVAPDPKAIEASNKAFDAQYKKGK